MKLNTARHIQNRLILAGYTAWLHEKYPTDYRILYDNNNIKSCVIDDADSIVYIINLLDNLQPQKGLLQDTFEAIQ